MKTSLTVCYLLFFRDSRCWEEGGRWSSEAGSSAYHIDGLRDTSELVSQVLL